MLTLSEIMTRIEFCSAQMHDADGIKLAMIKEELLDLDKQLTEMQNQLETLC